MDQFECPTENEILERRAIIGRVLSGLFRVQAEQDDTPLDSDICRISCSVVATSRPFKQFDDNLQRAIRFAVQRNWGQLKPCLSSRYPGSVETVVDALIVSVQQMYSALN